MTRDDEMRNAKHEDKVCLIQDENLKAIYFFDEFNEPEYADGDVQYGEL
jgi:hypothetical protein